MKKPILLLSLLIGIFFALPIAAEMGQVSRLPALPDPPTDPILKQMFAERKAMGADIINLQLTTGHAPKISQATGTLAFALRFDTSIPGPLRELTIVRTAEIVGSDYELAQHRPFLLACGYSQTKLDAVESWPISILFDDKERALLAYIEEVAHGGNVDDATYAKFASFFNPQQIVEITVTIGNYIGNGVLTKALKVQLETDGRHTAPGKC